jgi:hypothetical protein
MIDVYALMLYGLGLDGIGSGWVYAGWETFEMGRVAWRF